GQSSGSLRPAHPLHDPQHSLSEVGQVQDGVSGSGTASSGGGAPNLSRQSFRAAARCRFASNP
ncbi:MAG: hypothetical protein KDD47_28795, partial [Acidobacteria bacterium]|nr:hypothetical protein [Acidobacteriota bacterium]